MSKHNLKIKKYKYFSRIKVGEIFLEEVAQLYSLHYSQNGSGVLN